MLTSRSARLPITVARGHPGTAAITAAVYGFHSAFTIRQVVTVRCFGIMRCTFGSVYVSLKESKTKRSTKCRRNARAWIRRVVHGLRLTQLKNKLLAQQP
jgi:hypothetical protein